MRRNLEEDVLQGDTLRLVELLDHHRRLTPRDERGWPTYELLMANVFKQAPPPLGFDLDSGHVPAWSKVVEAGGAAEGGGGQQRQRPPMAPSRFAARLESLIFTNAADRGVVSELYRKTLEDGFGGLTALRYPKLDWGDAEWAELRATLREVRCPHVVDLDLNRNRELRSAEALARL